MTRVRTSLCMIVRDEEINLADCLRDVRCLFDEMVIVDTGSTDRSRDIATELGGRVFDFTWRDDFAAARNFSMEQARGEWIFWLDADDRLDASNREKLAQILVGLRDTPQAYLMRQLSGPKHDGSLLAIDHVRLFPRLPGVTWRGRVHEQLTRSLQVIGVPLVPTDIVIEHRGYGDSYLVASKKQRNRRLLERQCADAPDDPYFLYCLGAACLEDHELDRAILLLENARSMFEGDSNLLPQVHAQLSAAYRAAGQLGDALATCQAARLCAYPNDPAVLFEYALVHREQGDFDGAEAWLKKLLSLSIPHCHPGLDLTILSSRPKYLLGAIYLEQGRVPEAERVWRDLTQDEPASFLGWKGLGILALGRRDWGAVEEIAAKLMAAPGGYQEALILRSQMHVARGELSLGEALLSQAVAAAPRDIAPKLLLAQCYLRQQAWHQALALLEEVLRLQPANAEAQRNLRVLNSRRESSH